MLYQLSYGPTTLRRRVAAEPLRNQRPAARRLDANADAVEYGEPGVVLDARVVGLGVCAIVVMHVSQDRAVQVPNLRSHVKTDAIVDLLEERAAGHRTVARFADFAEQRGLAVVQRPTARGHEDACGIIPAVSARDELGIEGVSLSRPEPGEAVLRADRSRCNERCK